ncbi:DNA-binding response regulator [Pseudoroseomonas deserti]|uniref:DNA-binding response regulator n=1 Tax=Teichococcus deserti TaxID=1817963 RepID=A0A1V2H3B6_9PROT|nr:response regulator transcription factor [Pseudoroseomonas deserti]ONG53793.1 DNA-binding response regulator [Pseudoroseomonas deserti]
MTPRRSAPLRILLADDHAVLRRGLRGLLEERAGWQVCAEAESGRAAIELAARLRPEVAILDLALPGPDGLAATRAIRGRSPGTEVLIFARQHSAAQVRAVLAAGARGYLLTSDAEAAVIAAVEALAARRPYFSDAVGDTALAGFLRAGENTQDIRLTLRETEIVQLLAEGMSNKAVAARLAISVKTVETHRTAAMRKLDAHSVVDLVRYALRAQLTSI